MKKAKKFFVGLLKLVLCFVIVSALFLVGVVIYFSDSPKEFFILRKDNAVEYVLNKEDGVTFGEMAKSVYASYLATVEARTAFPSEPMLDDAYKHFTWSYETTRLIGEEKAKLITDNHEMALSLREALAEKYRADKISYLNESGIGKYFATPRAIKSTLKAAADIRRDYTANAKRATVSNINDFYSDATIMDFYNNESGREYAFYDESLIRSEVFCKALEQGQIMKSWDNLSEKDYEYAVNYAINQIDYK